MKRFCFLALFLALLLTACGSNAATGTNGTPSATKSQPTPTPVPPDGYLRNDSEGVRWLKWTEDTTGKVLGTWNTATLTDNKPVYSNGTLTGTHNGTAITLQMNLGSSSLGITATGTLKDGVLDLETPGDGGAMQKVEYHGVSQAQYDQALADFKAKHPA